MNQGYDNNLKFALFHNDQQREGKRDPDMRGSVEIDGVAYWMDGWWNESKNGTQYLNGKLKPKQVSESKGGTRGPPPRTSAPRGGPPPRQAAPARETAPADDFSDEPPF